MTVLVTGGTGFIGGHCVRELLEHGHPVRTTVRDAARADVAPLRALAAETGGSLELVEASLDADRGWAEAVAGCEYVWHVASPAPAAMPADEAELVRPAVDGTLRVLGAAADAGVRRVVLTSSIDAVRHGHPEQRVFTEDDWSVVDGLDPYPKSKTLAERAAWAAAADRDLELAVVNPGLVLGPLWRAEANVSAEVIRLLLVRGVPAVPRLGFAVVDVRDVATLHRLAMLAPEAAGNRYIAAGEQLWLGEIAELLAAEYAPRGYRVPTRALPYPLMWAAARFDRTLRTALALVDVPASVSSAKAARDLGWTARPAEESVLATAESLIRLGVVPERAPRHPR
ncbi:NAD-dependent epimerase/dehydratase family protein [Pseudonocardia pini]|uniref:NAD-dependent epimerase/dehydratase family protein n=1 Tax=Pseudonocardia pini TaxID=2758030 RepID=UPI0015F09A29|nr:NAD-dependent epimerase/dehydratase family protein [Pseudonocardia pini]